MERAMLVYQAGIANVFEVDCFNLSPLGRNARRLIQGDFRTCETFARGLVAAGVIVTTVHCNMAGDIADAKWSDNLDGAPWNEKFCPVYSKGVQRTIDVRPKTGGKDVEP